MNHPKKNATATLPLVRCAVYTRKSTEEGAVRRLAHLSAFVPVATSHSLIVLS